MYLKKEKKKMGGKSYTIVALDVSIIPLVEGGILNQIYHFWYAHSTQNHKFRIVKKEWYQLSSSYR